MASAAYVSNLWERVRTSYWFVPSLLTLLAAIASVILQRLDYAYAGRLPADAWWLYSGNADGARTVLGAVAGSMITVASVVFSITIVTLTLASGQFGPRLLRTFIRDRGNQIVLGVFIATFIYSLLVLRSVRGGEDAEFVPVLSITVAVGLAVASVGVLIYFIHHVAVAIQADEVIASVVEEVDEALARLFPTELGHSPPDTEGVAERAAPPPQADGRLLRAGRDGYLQSVDADKLMELACDHDLLIELKVRPGAFLAETTPIARAWPGERIDEPLVEKLSATFVLGPHRNLTQDAEYGIMQLVEIAVRALSPGINDPFTAMSCLDRLGAALCRLAGRRFPASRRYDEQGTLRVIADVPSFGDFIDSAFDQVRHNARSTPAVLIRLLEVVNRVAENANTDEQRDALREHARLIRSAGDREFSEARARAALEAVYRRSEVLLGPGPSSDGLLKQSA